MYCNFSLDCFVDSLVLNVLEHFCLDKSPFKLRIAFLPQLSLEKVACLAWYVESRAATAAVWRTSEKLNFPHDHLVKREEELMRWSAWGKAVRVLWTMVALDHSKVCCGMVWLGTVWNGTADHLQTRLHFRLLSWVASGQARSAAWLTAPGFQANVLTTSNGSIPNSSLAVIAKYTAWFPLLFQSG